MEITALDNSRETELIVKDNGIGISEETLATLFTDAEDTGIGLKNVNDRLKSKYGEEYGLDIESRLGQGGTIIKMRIPKGGVA